MSAFEPMGEEKIRASGIMPAAATLSVPDVIWLASTALHHLARAKALETERDDAQARVRELEAMTSTATIRDVHKALGAAPGESVVTKAEVVVAAAKAYGMVIDDARAILGAREDEMLSDAARRVVDAGPHKTVLDEARKAMGLEVGESVVDRVKDFRRTEVLIFEARKHLEPLVSDPSGDIEDLAVMVAHRVAALVREATDLRARLDADAEPDPMHPIPVHHTYAGDSTEVVIRITSRDPALLSLPFGARLAVVRLP
jgi:hypothetical protein